MEGIDNNVIDSDFKQINESLNDIELEDDNVESENNISNVKSEENRTLLSEVDDIPRDNLSMLSSETESSYSLVTNNDITYNSDSDNSSNKLVESFNNTGSDKCSIDQTEENVEKYIKKLLKHQMYGCDENTVNKSDELEKTQTNGDMMEGQMELFEQTNGTSKDALIENVSVPKTCEGIKPDEIHTMYDKLTTNNNNCENGKCDIIGVSANNTQWSNV